ncbi:hypothetical protein JQ625_27360 [Bradyrhizobium diazoefficiens]|nr:hypothetical protein [Bradyrhizobium diazoefficiens]MBR0778567.1 hypothetical protein [Bradyrhizobium diazoefficiens]
MSETVEPIAPIPRPRSRRSETVSASALAQHLDCSPAYIDKLEAEGVIQRQGDGFPLDQSRIAYIRHLRRERRQSPRSEADAALVAAKTEMLQLRLMEKKGELLSREDFDEAIDSMAGIVVTHLSGMAARCSNDLIVRRKIDALVHQVRRELAEHCIRSADKRGERPLSELG